MKRSTINLMFAAAALMAASTVASAQTLKAQIPFSFRANGVVLAPGAYNVTTLMDGQMIQLSNVAARASVFLGKGTEEDAPRAWRKAGKPTLQFTCSNGNCSLTRIWTGTQISAHTYALPHDKSEGRTVASIRLINVSLN